MVRDNKICKFINGFNNIPDRKLWKLFIIHINKLPPILTNTEHALTIGVSKMTNSNYFAIFFPIKSTLNSIQ